MIDYMKSGFDLLEENQREKNVNKNKNNNNYNRLNNLSRKNEVETAEEYYELKFHNDSDYSTETFESLEFAEDDVDMVNSVQKYFKDKLNKDKK